jgi:hypothetical protein
MEQNKFMDDIPGGGLHIDDLPSGRRHRRGIPDGLPCTRKNRQKQQRQNSEKSENPFHH